MTQRQFRIIKFVGFLFVSFALLFAEQLCADEYFKPNPLFGTGIPVAVAPETNATMPCMETTITGFSIPYLGVSMSSVEEQIDQDCRDHEIRAAAEKAVDEARGIETNLALLPEMIRLRLEANKKAADFLPEYREQKEKQFFAELMHDHGYAKINDKWKKPDPIELFFLDTPWSGKEALALGMAAVILLIVFGFILLMRRMGEPRIKD